VRGTRLDSPTLANKRLPSGTAKRFGVRCVQNPQQTQRGEAVVVEDTICASTKASRGMLVARSPGKCRSVRVPKMAILDGEDAQFIAFLQSAEFETALFDALFRHRPVGAPRFGCRSGRSTRCSRNSRKSGLHRHFHMVDVMMALQETLGARCPTSVQVWDKLATMYNLDALVGGGWRSDRVSERVACSRRHSPTERTARRECGCA
jgi:hypothetical protein